MSPKRFRWSLIGLVLAAAGGTAYGAASPASEPPRPDITHYDIRIRPDFQMARLAIRADVAIENPGLDTVFTFTLGERYAARVEERGGTLDTRREGRRIKVAIRAPRKEHRLRFEIQGTPGRSDDEDREVITPHDLFLLWSDAFYPVSFEDWATVRTEISLPERFQAVAPGRMTRTRRGRGEVTYVFETARPARLFSVFADDRWIQSEREVGGIRMRTLLHPESDRFTEEIFKTSADVLRFYSDLHGEYAFDQFSFVTIEGMYARRAFTGFIGYSPEYLAKEMERVGHDAHETALLWWIYTLGGRGPGSFQWAEGFGDYAEVLYDEDRRLPLAPNLVGFREDYLATPASEDVPFAELRGRTPQKFVHGKLPWLMHVIRYVVGDGPFRQGLRSLFDRHRFRTFSIDEFTAAMEEGTGQSLRWWRTEWLDRQGVPELGMRSEIDSLAGGYRVRLRITQEGNIYHVPLEIGIETERGIQIERVMLENRETTCAFESAQRPTRILLDPYRWLLLRIRAPSDGAPDPR